MKEMNKMELCSIGSIEYCSDNINSEEVEGGS